MSFCQGDSQHLVGVSVYLVAALRENHETYVVGRVALSPPLISNKALMWST